MEIDDRELRLRDRMLRNDEGGSRVVIADLRLGKLGLASFGRARPNLARRQLLGTDDAEGDDAESQEQRKDSFHIKSVRSRPVSRILSLRLGPPFGGPHSG